MNEQCLLIYCQQSNNKTYIRLKTRIKNNYKFELTFSARILPLDFSLPATTNPKLPIPKNLQYS